jgi:hypothetical protein
MRKLILTCECGQRMQVPRSAIGKLGMCPQCNRTIRITGANTAGPGAQALSTERNLGGKRTWWTGSRQGHEPSEEDKRRFGEAVDLYYGGRYAEALAIFDELARLYPGSNDIEAGRRQCTAALSRGPKAPRGGERPALPDGAALDEETVRRVVLEKLLAADDEAVQLQAADIACRMLGLYPGAAAAGDHRQPADGLEDTRAEPVSQEEPAGEVYDEPTPWGREETG